MEEDKPPIITKRILILGFTAPFIFSIGGILVAYYATQHLSESTRNIALIVATFIGLLLSIGLIFLMQWNIKRKLKKAEGSKIEKSD